MLMNKVIPPLQLTHIICLGVMLMSYSETDREIQEIISRLYGEPIAIEEALEVYHEMMDSDLSESFLFTKNKAEGFPNHLYSSFINSSICLICLVSCFSNLFIISCCSCTLPSSSLYLS